MKCLLKQSVLRNHIIKKNIPYAKFAQSIGVSRQHLSAMLSGRIGVSAELRKKILKKTMFIFEDIFIIS
jgi:plasmid maintenance system antidote protein VapI